MKFRSILSSVIALVIYLGCLFGSAGTWKWPEGWAFVVIMLVMGTVMRVKLAKVSPGLLKEREGSPIQKDQPLWDKVFFFIFLPSFIAWLILIGMDAVRYRWSDVPLWLEIVGGVAVCGSFPMFYWVFRENAFAAPVVKLQKERGQHVIMTGPYAIVRHPMYTAMVILFPAITLLLGSYYGLIGAGFLGLLIVVRTALEDRMLQQQLEGYAEYTEKVKYRLVPGIW